MRYSFSPHHLHKRPEQDLQIEQEGKMYEIMLFEFNYDGDRREERQRLDHSEGNYRGIVPQNMSDVIL